MDKYTSYKNALEHLTYPYAVLDMDLFRQNIRTNCERAGSKKIRIASKSLRCVEVMRLLLEHSDQIQGIMTYHGLEAVALSQMGFDDLLMGYPVVDKQVLRKIGLEIREGKKIYCMVDHPVHLEILEEIGSEMKLSFPVCIDLDLSDDYPGLRFGVWRSKINSIVILDAFLDQIKKCKYVTLSGLMGYEAQIAGVGDKAPGQKAKNGVIRRLQKRSVKRLRKLRVDGIKLIREKGFELDFVNGGGTGSLETTREESDVTEVTVGSGFYASHLFDYYRNFQLQPALFYGVQIVRQPDAKTFTCHGGGFIASGAVEATKAPIIHLPTGGKLNKNEGAGEVQTPIHFQHVPSGLEIGDPIFLRHAKAGELLERFKAVHFLDDNKITSVLTYRGMNWSFG